MDNPQINIDHAGQRLREYLKSEPFFSYQTDLYNQLLEEIVPKIISERRIPIHDSKHNDRVGFKLSRYGSPAYSAGNKTFLLTPNQCRNDKRSYTIKIFVKPFIERTIEGKTVTEMKEGEIDIGDFPLMLGSRECILYGRDPKVMIQNHEDANDPLGYFIIEGHEKICLIHIKLRQNKILCFKSKASEPVTASCIQTVGGTKRTHIKMEGNIYKVMLPFVPKPSGSKGIFINVCQIFNLCGFKNPNDILNMIRMFLPSKYATQLYPTLADYQSNSDFENEYKSVTKSVLPTKNIEPLEAMKKFINDDVFPLANNIYAGNSKLIYLSKCLSVAQMIAKLAIINAGGQQDMRDDWGNKQVTMAATMIEKLFRSIWNERVTNAINNKTSYTDIVSSMSANIWPAFRMSFQGESWGTSKTNNTKKLTNVSQILRRESMLSTIQHVTRTDARAPEQDTRIIIRKVKPSQEGFICVVETPDDSKVGITENIALTAKVSKNIDPVEIFSILSQRLDLGFTDLGKIDDIPQKETNNYSWFSLNASIVGKIKTDSFDKIISMKRRSEIYNKVSIVKEGNVIFMCCDDSRLVRPLLVVRKDGSVPLTISEAIKTESFEYMDPWECNNRATVAYHEEDIKIRSKRYFSQLSSEKMSPAAEKVVNELSPFNYCELDPIAIFGLAAAVVPMVQTNQAPRNAFAANNAKQPVSVHHSSLKYRLNDLTIKYPAAPNHPLIMTEMDDLVGSYSNPSGQNLKVAFINMRNNEDDAFIMKKSSVELGKLSYFKRIILKTTLSSMEELRAPDKEYIESAKRSHPKGRDRFANIGENGLPYIGVKLEENDCVLGKVLKSKDEKMGMAMKNVFIGIGEAGVVEDVICSVCESVTIVSVVIKIHRFAAIGNKIAPRQAQKCTMGLILPDEDMPFASDGSRPDIIINTHCIPSRMTMEYIIEIIGGTTAALLCKRINGTSYRKFDWNEFSRNLSFLGFSGDKSTSNLDIKMKIKDFETKYGNDKTKYTPVQLEEYRRLSGGIVSDLQLSLINANDEETKNKILKDIEIEKDLQYRMLRQGYDTFGSQVYFDGRTGNKYMGRVFSGPVYINNMRHHTIDKIQSRGYGPVSLDTGQATAGKGVTGGIRGGGMEFRAYMSHGGISKFEELYVDRVERAFCMKCGASGIESTSNRGVFECERARKGLCKNSVIKKIPFLRSTEGFKSLMGGVGFNVAIKTNKSQFDSKKEMETNTEDAGDDNDDIPDDDDVPDDNVPEEDGEGEGDDNDEKENKEDDEGVPDDEYDDYNEDDQGGQDDMDD